MTFHHFSTLAYCREQLQPERSNLSAVWDELVRPKCPHAGEWVEPESPPASLLLPAHGLWRWRADVPLPTDGTACKLYVNPTSGKDSPAASGGATAPFATIAFAVSRVQPGTAGCTVLLADGTHPVAKTITIGPRLTNLTIMPAPGATAIISGAVELKGLQWQPVHAPAPAAATTPGATVMMAKVPATLPQLLELFSANAGRPVKLHNDLTACVCSRTLHGYPGTRGGPSRTLYTHTRISVLSRWHPGWFYADLVYADLLAKPAFNRFPPGLFRRARPTTLTPTTRSQSPPAGRV